MVYSQTDSLHPAMAVELMCSATIVGSVAKVFGDFADIRYMLHAVGLENR